MKFSMFSPSVIIHSKNHVVKFTTAKTYSVRFQKLIESKILFILTFNRFGVFMPKMSPNGRRFESLSGQIIIFPIKYTRNVKSMQNTVKSTVTVIER
jgi:hypothetical protein